MNKRNISYILLGVGLVLAALSLFADSLGLSANTTFGYKQIAGLVIGIVVVIAGAILLRRRPE